jgi:hypothetical protein
MASGRGARLGREPVNDFRDPRFAYALRLLHECLHPHGAPAGTTAPSWTSSLDWLQSSTDVLTPWYPDAAAPIITAGPPSPFASAWDAYFAPVTSPVPAVAGDNWTPSLSGPGGDAALALLRAPAAVTVDAVAVESVVDALYSFLHALGRGDVAAAMEHVDQDYHAMDGDHEITCEALRHQLEQLIDERRSRGLDISLTQVPEPIAHPLGMLVKLTIQIDSRSAAALPESLLLYRIAVFRQSAEGRWLLTSLASVD